VRTGVSPGRWPPSGAKGCVLSDLVPGVQAGQPFYAPRPAPGWWRGCADPQHVLRRKQDPSVGTTSPRVWRPAPLFLPGRIAEPVLTPSAIADLCRKSRTKKAPIAAP
jgi:hypothetical protein